MSQRFRIAAARVLFLVAPALAQGAQQQGKGQANPPLATPATLSGQDQSFLQQAAEAATSEIKLGQLAVDKASSPEVKRFGQQAVGDFGKAQKGPDKIAGDLKWIAPDHMSQARVGQTAQQTGQKVGS